MSPYCLVNMYLIKKIHVCASICPLDMYVFLMLILWHIYKTIITFDGCFINLFRNLSIKEMTFLYNRSNNESLKKTCGSTQYVEALLSIEASQVLQYNILESKQYLPNKRRLWVRKNSECYHGNQTSAINNDDHILFLQMLFSGIFLSYCLLLQSQVYAITWCLWVYAKCISSAQSACLFMHISHKILLLRLPTTNLPSASSTKGEEGTN